MPRNDEEGNGGGPQKHAEGQQGEKTHQAFLESLHRRDPDSQESQATQATQATQGNSDFDEFGIARPGHHRLQEDRQQHDEAEKNSETNRQRR